MPPGMRSFRRRELRDETDLTDVEVESAFVSWWAVVLHRFWVSSPHYLERWIDLPKVQHP
jgi:hypothetical protein